MVCGILVVDGARRRQGKPRQPPFPLMCQLRFEPHVLTQKKRGCPFHLHFYLISFNISLFSHYFYPGRDKRDRLPVIVQVSSW